MRYSHSTRPGSSIARSIADSDEESSPGAVRHEICRPLRVGAVRMALQTALVAALSAGSGVVMAAGDAQAGAAKAWTCLGCHGVDHYVNVYPSYHVPRIAGQNEEYLISALQSYRGKLRAHPTMQANASLLSDQDIEDIAAWLSQQGAGQ